MKSCILGLFRDSEEYIQQSLTCLDNLLAYEKQAGNEVRIFLLENDSKDNTKEIYQADIW